MTASWIGFTAAAISILAFLPQVARAWRTRHTKDLSLATVTLLLSGAALWTVYGTLVRDLPVVVTNATIMALLLLLLTAKLRFG